MEKIKHALEEARRQRLGLDSAGTTPEVIMKQLDPDIVDRIRRLRPINQYPYHYQDFVIKEGEIINFPRGSRIFIEGSQDEFVHYLLKGSVAILISGLRANHFSANSEVSTFPLDEPGKRRETSAAVEQTATVFRVRHALLQRAVDLPDSAPLPEVVDITSADDSDSIVATLRQGLFANLPIETIQLVLSRVEKIDVEKGETVVMQGEPGDFFYLMKSGTAEVHHRPSRDAASVHLGDIKAGDGIGEEALIADQARNATVTMTSDGVLMKMTREDFDKLIRKPLLDDIALDVAERMITDGAVWIDARSEELFADSAMPGAINVPLPLIRVKYQKLDPARTYVVYSNDPSASAVAAFLLSARGLIARSVNVAVRPLPAERTDDGARSSQIGGESLTADNAPLISGEPADPQRSEDLTEIEPAEPEFYAQTHSGKGLAQLVQEIRSDHEEIESQAVQDPTEITVTGTSNINLESTSFGLDLDALQEDSHAPATSTAEALSAVADRVQDPIAEAIRALETAFREEIENVRREERERIERHVQGRVAHIRKRAEEIIREKLLLARARDKERTKLAEERLRQNYEKLKRMANKITHQKAEIQRARHQLQQKLLAAEEVHRQLADLGQTMTQQLDNLDGMMPEEDIKFSA
jgi:rhodanese-related sulfurtransferase